MKFVHIADMHFDMPFTLLSKNDLAEERRIDQRKVFQKAKRVERRVHLI